MKKLLPILVLLFATVSSKLAYSQCNFVSPTVEVNFISTASPGFCNVNFNLSFEIDQNSGNKYTFIHLWQTANYTSWINNPSYTSYTTNQGSQPEFNDAGGSDPLNILQDAVATIVLNNDNVPLTFETQYGPDTDAPVKTPGNTSGLTITRQVSGSNFRYTISNLGVTVPTPPGGCLSSLSFTGDAWSSQANNANPPIHCATSGFTFTINDVNISGFKQCATPMKYNIGISTTATTPYNVYYDVYVDNGDGIFNTATDFLVVNDNGPHTISAGSPYSASLQGFDNPNSPYDDIAYKENVLWYLITSPTLFSNVALYEANNSCATLPVTLSSFTAVRNQSNVLLQWQTATEERSSGFAVERNLGNNNWEQIAFVPTQAIGGNSSSILKYQYTDLNTAKGVSQYRIRQTDLDNKSALSEIRSVRGNGQPGKTIVYPNPSTDGKVSIVFEEKNVTRDIAITDMSGRVVKQLKNVISNNVSIENLVSGMYSIRILSIDTGEVVVEKIVVNRR
jgi:Secretion system C-terminal sorting domain